MTKSWLLSGCVTLATATSMDRESVLRQFSEFQKEFDRKYDSDAEREMRLQVFTENMKILEEMSVTYDPNGAQYSHLTPFADWTPEEFKGLNNLRSEGLFSQNAEVIEDLNASTLPDAFDWREKGAVNEVKNQGSCGSCWSFATVANIEGSNFLKTGKLLSLSEQQFVDCDHNGDQGCQGGLPSNAYDWMIKGKIGLEAESQYPYKGSNNKCVADKSKELVFIADWKKVSQDEDQIAAAMMQYGPLAIGINAGPMQLYFGGIADPWLCAKDKLDHGVAIVGFGSGEKGIFKKTLTKYWTIRNSWGPSWGEKGYYRIVRGTGACGLNTMVTTAITNSNIVV